MRSNICAPRPRQGIPPDRKSDTGPIPPAMLDDLRTLLWRLEKPPKYWAAAMGIVIGALWVAGIVWFAITDTRRSVHDYTMPVGALALSALAAMAYAPFGNRAFDEGWAARDLRKVLYNRRLEDLAEHMKVLRFGRHEKLADRLVEIWQRNGVEPGWAARREEPLPLFH